MDTSTSENATDAQHISPQRKLRVLLLFPHFNTLEQASSLRSWQIGRFLAARGHDVIAFAPGVDLRSGERLPGLGGKLFQTEMIDGVRVVRVRTLRHFRRSPLHRLVFEAVFAGLTFFKALATPRADVILSAYPPAVLPVFSVLISRLKGCPLVFEMRDLLADGLEVTGYITSRLFLKIARASEAFLIRRSTHCVAVTPGIRDFIISKGIDQQKVTTITNGYEPEVFEQVDDSFDARAEFGWHRRFVVIYAGGLTQAYDIPTLLRAAKRLSNDSEILIAIVGEGTKKDEYKEYCRNHRLGNVQFIDYQQRKRMATILKVADVGVHLFPDNPFWGHVLGNKTFDYLGAGIPMIYAGTGDTAKLLKNSGGGLTVRPEDDESLAAAILMLKSEPGSAKKMGDDGRRHVVAHYHRHRLLEQLEDLLLHIVGARTT